MRKIAFEPIADEKSQILILGTMPSEESLRKQERYGHKSNQFWKIVFILFEKPLPDNYDEKIRLLTDNHIAIWDVLHSCEGSGSLDSSIKNEKPNDFKKFFKQYPQIKHIFFTSKKAEEFYKRYVGFEKDKMYTTLPSPSSANARMSLIEKVEKWKILRDSAMEINSEI